MHLDRKHFARVEELQQQWESTKTSGQFSQQLLRRLLQQLTDGPPFERSIGDAARMVLPVAEQPGFADGPSPGNGALSRSASAGRPRADTDRSARSAEGTDAFESF